MDSKQTLWVLGGGSGVGRAVSIAAAAAGWRVAVTGRRSTAVAETALRIRQNGGSALEVPADARNPDTLKEAHRQIIDQWGPVTAVVLAAGLNTPTRTWADQTMEDFEAVVDTNLVSVARAVDRVLPDMRSAGQGNIIVISSRAAWRFSPGSGVAYMTSKTALSALVASINDQERTNGIKACHLCPGDVDTDFLSLRPEVPNHAQRSLMLSPDDVARAVLFVLESPSHVRIDELALSPAAQG